MSKSPKSTASKAPAKKAVKAKEPTTPEAKMAAIKAKYPNRNIVDGSLQFNEAKQKYSVEIVCGKDGCTTKRRVFTSDLFQVGLCEAHTKEARRSKRKTKRNAMKAALKAATPKG